MKNYEVMYILTPMKEEEVKRINKKIRDTIENNGGQVEKEDLWGIRHLAYEIRYYEKGFYVLTSFKAERETIVELDRVMKIQDEVLRHMIIRKGE